MVVMTMHNIDKSFEKHFPNLAKEFKLKGFKLKDFQKRVINNVLEGHNTLCIMPTGGGKSLIYWMSGSCLGGITIVISPLIALIDEQTEKLSEQGYEVLTIHGGMDAGKQAKILIDFANNVINPKFIFVSPEKIATDGLFEHCIKERKDEITLIAIDEVHCVSQWGASFRPFYKRIPTCIDDIYAYANQTNGIVRPMLNRIQKCRQLILFHTDGSLDIFDDPVLKKYKRYFGDY
jgi:ATP-dependent DNA helicase RecQ